MNPVVEQARHAAFQQTLLSARRTMLMSEILKLAIDSFRASKLRFALTALGMVIGTASVILVVTIGLTGRQFILNEIQKIGTNEVEVEYSGGGAVGAEKVQYNDFLTREDEKAVLAQVPSVRSLFAGARIARPHQLWRRSGEGHTGAGCESAVQAGAQPDRALRALLRRAGRDAHI